MSKPIVAVFGGNRVDAATAREAEELGRALIDAGFRIVCGGLGGVMAATSCGARSSSRWTGSEVIGVLPGWTRDEAANPWVDISLATGMGSQRNNVVARVADAAIALGGGAGTLSEIALAWHEGRPLACLTSGGGWAERLAGERLDERREQPIVRLESVAAVRAWLDACFPVGVWDERGPAAWWPEQVPCLHRVHDGPPTGARVIQAELGMSLALEQLAARLHDLAMRVRSFNHAHGQRRRALVTIDDGHAEVASLVPIFAALPDLQPILFVTAGLLEGDVRPLPLTALYAWCVASGRSLARAQAELGIDRIALKQLPEVEQRQRLHAAGVPLVPSDECMIDRAGLERLREAGWWIGSHGPEHHDLRSRDDHHLARELLATRNALVAQGGVPWLAWPEGRCTRAMCERAREAGFARCFGLEDEPGCEPSPGLVRRRVWS